MAFGQHLRGELITNARTGMSKQTKQKDQKGFFDEEAWRAQLAKQQDRSNH